LGVTKRRLLLWPLWTTLLLAAVGYWPTLRLAGAEKLGAMWMALVVVWLVILITLRAGLTRMASAPQTERLKIGMAVGVVRMFATVPIAGAIAFRKLVDPPVFLIWVALSYVVMIKVETIALLRWDKLLEKQDA